MAIQTYLVCLIRQILKVKAPNFVAFENLQQIWQVAKNDKPFLFLQFTSLFEFPQVIFMSVYPLNLIDI